MYNTLKITVKQRSNKGEASVEGSYQLPSSTPTKLQRKDGSTQFPTRAALNTSARRLAENLGWTLVFDEPVKKAAKKSVKAKTKSSKPKTADKSATSSDPASV